MTSKMKDQYIAIVIAINFLFLGFIYISTIQTRIPNDTSINGAPVETMEQNEKVAPQAQKETMKNDEKSNDLNDCLADFKTRLPHCIIAGIRKTGTRGINTNEKTTFFTCLKQPLWRYKKRNDEKISWKQRENRHN